MGGGTDPKFGIHTVEAPKQHKVKPQTVTGLSKTVSVQQKNQADVRAKGSSIIIGKMTQSGSHSAGKTCRARREANQTKQPKLDLMNRSEVSSK